MFYVRMGIKNLLFSIPILLDSTEGQLSSATLTRAYFYLLSYPLW